MTGGTGDILCAQHRDMLERGSGISAEAIRARGYRTVTRKAELTGLGFKPYQAVVPGLLVPICGPQGEVASYQFRPDYARTSTKGKPIKYESLAGTAPRLDVPPGCRQAVLNPKLPLWITEGVKKSDAAASRGLVCVALPGVWNFRGKNSEDGSTTIGDFEQIALKGRDVYIAFDSDAVDNQSVRSAEKRLAGFLSARGAKVKVLRIPSSDGRKVGLDDYLAVGGDPLVLIGQEAKPAPIEARPDTATSLLELIKQANIELWHDSEERPYATYQRGQVHRSDPVESAAFRSMCAGLYYKSRGKPLTGEAMQTALATVAAEGSHDGEERTVGSRVQWGDGRVYLAIHDDRGTVIEVTREGWKATGPADCPVRFVKGRSAQALPMPVTGGDLGELSKFVNVDECGLALAQAFLLGCFLPEGTFPVLAVNGEQGSGKTFGCARLRWLIDPVKSPLRTQPKEHKELMAALASSYMPAFDNVSSLSAEQSDALCRIASGTGLQARQFHTNTDEVVIETRRPILLNGIEDVATRPDLAERSLLVQFRRLEGIRRSEADLKRDFDAAAPRMLGALLDRVSRAIKRWGDMPDPDFRLCDFARWVYAGTPDKELEVLNRALAENRASMQMGILEDDCVAACLSSWLTQEGPRTLPAGELLRELTQHLGTDKVPKDWPQGARGMSGRLTRLAPALRGAGFAIDPLERTAKARNWYLAPPGYPGSEPSQPSQPSQSEATESERAGAKCDGEDDGAGAGLRASSRSHVAPANLAGHPHDVRDGHDGLDRASIGGVLVASSVEIVNEGGVKEAQL